MGITRILQRAEVVDIALIVVLQVTMRLDVDVVSEGIDGVVIGSCRAEFSGIIFSAVVNNKNGKAVTIPNRNPALVVPNHS